jgi:hypothetical protein|tara:strand:- start:3665 stop:4393 length:729 start_codon:yes stop_codon:yes gene_type:complete
MLGNEYFYNETLKKIVSIFGTIFNDLEVANISGGKMVGVKRVPLAYAPKEKYLARVKEETERDVALKLPRMSFEMTDISYDETTKLNRLNRTIQTDATSSPESKVKVWQPAPYELGFDLNIMSRGQDEALQIVEQILPHFSPHYSLTVKGLEGPESKTDVPISLVGVNFEDAYEGDFESSRRLIVYTLTFSLKTKFAFYPSSVGLIETVDTFFHDFDTNGVYVDAGVRVTETSTVIGTKPGT